MRPTMEVARAAAVISGELDCRVTVVRQDIIDDLNNMHNECTVTGALSSLSPPPSLLPPTLMPMPHRYRRVVAFPGTPDRCARATRQVIARSSSFPRLSPESAAAHSRRRCVCWSRCLRPANLLGRHGGGGAPERRVPRGRPGRQACCVRLAVRRRRCAVCMK